MYIHCSYVQCKYIVGHKCATTFFCGMVVVGVMGRGLAWDPKRMDGDGLLGGDEISGTKLENGTAPKLNT